MGISKHPLAPNVCTPTLHIGTVVNYTLHRGNPVQGQVVARCEWEGSDNGAAFALRYTPHQIAVLREQGFTVGNE
ncbi:Uncharacterised protein [Serratia quinivorans]|uniref:Uncharacterized protein n=1 Tax=Serratia quinivorans TaxID=137545 RepID=A0A380AHL3_9GAMM|nr:hypothetical protein BSR03_04210 [Serratia proteamaculans]SUI81065.1 Uncharacterised protein [Serratia quinivorans]